MRRTLQPLSDAVLIISLLLLQHQATIASNKFCISVGRAVVAFTRKTAQIRTPLYTYERVLHSATQWCWAPVCPKVSAARAKDAAPFSYIHREVEIHRIRSCRVFWRLAVRARCLPASVFSYLPQSSLVGATRGGRRPYRQLEFNSRKTAEQQSVWPDWRNRTGYYQGSKEH